jgi:hypothetical protein
MEVTKWLKPSISVSEAVADACVNLSVVHCRLTGAAKPAQPFYNAIEVFWRLLLSGDYALGLAVVRRRMGRHHHGTRPLDADGLGRAGGVREGF